MKYLAALVLTLAAMAARADSPDMKTYTCGAYLKFVVAGMSGKDDQAKTAVGIQMAWIFGYLSGLHESTVMDAKRFRLVMHELGSRCQAKPGELVATAAEAAWNSVGPEAASAPAAAPAAGQ
jgi:hypothetical protein